MSTERLEAFIARPRRAVWIVGAPMMAGMLLHVIYSVVDTAFVGRLGPQALAGLTVVFPLFFVMIAISNGIGTGITVLVAQAIGRRDAEAAERVASTALALGLVMGALFALGGLLGGEWMLRRLGASAEVTTAAWHYFAVLAAGAPIFFTSTNLRFVLTGEGDARTPMYVMAFVTLLNIGLDPIFIFTLGLGIRGAAAATVLAASTGLIAYLYLLLVRRRNVVRLRASYLWPRWQTVVEVLRIGVPSSLAQLAMALGALLMNRAVASYGDAALAGFGIGSRINTIVGMPILGLAGGSVAVIGMFAGAGRVDLIRSTTAYVFRWAVGIATVLGVLAWGGSGVILRVFTDDVATLAIGQHYLLYMLFVYPMMGFGMTAARLLLGIGYPMLSLLITTVRLLLVAVPVAYVAVFWLGTPIDGAWVGLIAGALISTILAGFLVRSVIWRGDPAARAQQRSSMAAPAAPEEATGPAEA